MQETHFFLGYPVMTKEEQKKLEEHQRRLNSVYEFLFKKLEELENSSKCAINKEEL